MTVGLNIWDFKSRQEFGKRSDGDAAMETRACDLLLWKMKNALFKKQDNRSNANDPTPFGRPLPRRDPQSAILHLAICGRLNVPGIFWFYFIDLHELYVCNPVCR